MVPAFLHAFPEYFLIIKNAANYHCLLFISITTPTHIHNIFIKLQHS